VSRYSSIKRCQARFVHFATLGFKCVQFGPKPQLRRAQVLRVASYAVLDVVAAEPKWSCIGLAAEGYVNVRVARIEMGDCYPLQVSAQIPFHPSEELSGMLPQVEPFAEFRRDDQLEESLIAGGLPGVQRFGRIYRIGGG
jgi:hypothetical protein